MDVRLDMRRIVEQEVEHIMTLMLVGPNDLRLDRHMIGHHAIGHHAFLEPEILR
jgi:hypothetical protein